jgi:hypothetical protein
MPRHIEDHLEYPPPYVPGLPERTIVQQLPELLKPRKIGRVAKFIEAIKHKQLPAHTPCRNPIRHLCLEINHAFRLSTWPDNLFKDTKTEEDKKAAKAGSKNNDGKLTKFTLFGQLPEDIRCMIWREALPEGPLVIKVKVCYNKRNDRLLISFNTSETDSFTVLSPMFSQSVANYRF